MNSSNQQLNKDETEIKLKVCGLSDCQQIDELLTLNTDFIGFIFYKKSPRFVLNKLNLEDISEINHNGKVGVFVNEKIDIIINISTKAKLNYIQLHGDETHDFVIELKEKLDKNIKIIKVIRIGNHSADELQNIINQQPKIIDFLLFDTDSKAFGGTGKSFDWQILNEIKIKFPYFLSGGISEENISLIHNLKQKPEVLDINSKFEIEAGNKDIDKIKNFKTQIKNLL